MKIQSRSNLITNSSSEVFIRFDGRPFEEIVKELDEIYPDWRDESDFIERMEEEFPNEMSIENALTF